MTDSADLFDNTTNTFKIDQSHKREKHVDYGDACPTCLSCIFKVICVFDPPLSVSGHCLAFCHVCCPRDWKFVQREKYGKLVKVKREEMARDT